MVKPNNTSEKQCTSERLIHACVNILILYDRGYPGFWLYALHKKLEQAFCMRTKTNQCLMVKAFYKKK
jgi:hypothetical protein